MLNYDLLEFGYRFSTFIKSASVKFRAMTCHSCVKLSVVKLLLQSTYIWRLLNFVDNGGEGKIALKYKSANFLLSIHLHIHRA